MNIAIFIIAFSVVVTIGVLFLRVGHRRAGISLLLAPLVVAVLLAAFALQGYPIRRAQDYLELSQGILTILALVGASFFAYVRFASGLFRARPSLSLSGEFVQVGAQGVGLRIEAAVANPTQATLEIRPSDLRIYCFWMDEVMWTALQREQGGASVPWAAAQDVYRLPLKPETTPTTVDRIVLGPGEEDQGVLLTAPPSGRQGACLGVRLVFLVGGTRRGWLHLEDRSRLWWDMDTLVILNDEVAQ